MLNQLSVEDSPPSIRHQNGKRSAKGGAHGSGSSLDATSPTHQQYLGIFSQKICLKKLMTSSFTLIETISGDAAAALPHWPDLEADTSQLPAGIDIDDLQAFVTLYRDHCEVSHNIYLQLQLSINIII